ncbi:type III pantothenate kinase [Flavobacterium restrictum]|uniref:Type III pantothenate kinase n=1 Tax=Flavobacterium restrictum TaxID=2594428 RepID=A0A553DU76_9FLAO|nr:type III pantothenate kinase [Flavobacterium restrictum]TRX36325.1 type III pantothenate kinase [Flavobacterium restrictum]
MVLVIDVGNTRIKGAVFEGHTLLDFFIFDENKLQKNIQNSLKKFPNVTYLVVSSVGSIEKKAFSTFEATLKVHFITRNNPFPFVNKYETPHTLGIDRMVLAAGATMLHPNRNRLIIDAGTCVTYDFIDTNNDYWGGAIAPGLRLRYESLHNYTEKLPLLSLQAPHGLTGSSTEASIHSGVVNGLVYEIDGFIDEYKAKYPNFIIILTGGDADFLANRLKNTIFANSNFLLESMNQTFQYKINND